MRYGEVLVDKSVTDLILRVLHYIVITSFGHILYCVCFHLYCGCFHLYCGRFKLFCDVWVGVRVGFVMCGCVGFVLRGCVCMCGFCNVWVCVCMGFVMCAFW